MVIQEKADWPLDSARIKSYQLYEALYRGDHRKAFIQKIAMQLYARPDDGITYLVFGYPALIVHAVTGLLVTAPPVVSYAEKELAEALQGVMTRSRLDAVLLEACNAAGAHGDSLLCVRKRADGVVIEPRPAYCYFPEVNPDNCREALSESLAWEREWKGRKVVRVDRYLPSRVVMEAFELSGTKIGRQMDHAEVMEMTGSESVVVPTGVMDRNTLVHLPNVRPVNSYFGVSDYDGLVPLFEEANYRASQISRILDKHADPKMAGPPIHTGPDKRIDLSQGYFQTTGGEAPKYITWDAKLEAAFEHLNRIEAAIYSMSEVSKALATTAQGARYDSGRAFRMQFAQTLAKAARKRLYLDPALKEAVRLAVAMTLGRSYEETPEPNVRWRDGLPKDMATDSQTENNRIASKTTSRASAIMRLDDCSELAAQAELDRIDAEQQRFGGVEMPPEVETPEEPDEESEDDGSEEEA